MNAELLTADQVPPDFLLGSEEMKSLESSGASGTLSLGTSGEVSIQASSGNVPHEDPEGSWDNEHTPSETTGAQPALGLGISAATETNSGSPASHQPGVDSSGIKTSTMSEGLGSASMTQDAPSGQQVSYMPSYCC